jgi:hypothetical protein
MSSSQRSANETAATGMIVVEPGQGTQMGPDLRLLGRAGIRARALEPRRDPGVFE